MTRSTEFANGRWIARPVSASQRIVREVRRSRIDWAEPGHSLAQGFHAEGPVEVVNLDIAGPRDSTAPNSVDVRFSIALRDAEGRVVAEKVVEGPQLVWDRFGVILEVTPTAPAGGLHDRASRRTRDDRMARRRFSPVRPRRRGLAAARDRPCPCRR